MNKVEQFMNLYKQIASLTKQINELALSFTEEEDVKASIAVYNYLNRKGENNG